MLPPRITLRLPSRARPVQIRRGSCRRPQARCEMSSPVVVPRPPRSMAGPLVLIILGVLLLLRTMGILRWSAWHVFARFWPLLLILWGVIKLIEYQQARREGLRP